MNLSYGIDAPKVVRNLFLVALLSAAGTLLSFQISSPLWFWAAFLYASATGIVCLAMGIWMLHSTLAAKPRIAKRLIEELDLKGNEALLDVGCGRGLFLIEAAKRLPKGKACGIDLWSMKDQSGNKEAQTLRNAKAENVQSRIELQTADMRKIPYPDQSFDAVISHLAIHNVPSAEGRSQALSEILRVLKPGGRFILNDIHFAKQYAAYFASVGTDAACSLPRFSYFPPIRTVKGKKR